MNKDEKIQFAESVFELMNKFNKQEIRSTPTFVGYLTKPFGINGFKTAAVDTPVFEKNDKYIIYLESLTGEKGLEVPFYKESLKYYVKTD